MMYKFMEFPDSTEVTHSEMREDGSVKVCVERPVEGAFKTAYWELPSCRCFGVEGFGADELAEQCRYLGSNAHLIIRFTRNGGFENASVF